MSDNKRNDILKAAENLFKQKGYKNTSIVQIASEARVSLRTIYSYFKSKEILFKTLKQPELLKYNPDDDNRKGFIIKTAIKIFAENGYPNTTMDDIASSCGYSKAILYRYFKGKNEIFASIFKVTEIFKGYDNFILKKPHISLNDYLKYCSINILKFFKDPDKFKIIQFFISGSTFQPQDGFVLFRNAIDKLNNKVAERLVYYTCNGVIKNIDYKMAARSFFGILYSFILTDEILDSCEHKYDIEKISDYTIKIFKKGILNCN